jgi:hypothetical protein
MLFSPVSRSPTPLIISNIRDQREAAGMLSRRSRVIFVWSSKIAHAFKHVETDGCSSLNQSQIIVRPPIYWGTAVWDLSRWDDETGGITVADNVHVDLLDAAKRAVALLREISQTNAAR